MPSWDGIPSTRGRRALLVLSSAALTVILLTGAAQFVTSGVPPATFTIATIDDLTPGVAMNWSSRVWVILDGYGEVHAFPTTYRVNDTRTVPVAWLPPSEEIAAIWLDRDPCARIAGDGIFYVYSPGSSRYDATGRHLFGPDRPRLDWYAVRVAPNGAISVDLSEVHRADWSNAADAGISTPTPVPRALRSAPEACRSTPASASP